MDGTIIPGVLARVFTTPIPRAAYLRRKNVMSIYCSSISDFFAIKLVKRMIWQIIASVDHSYLQNIIHLVKFHFLLICFYASTLLIKEVTLPWSDFH